MAVPRTFAASSGSVGEARRYVAGLTTDLPTSLQEAIALMVSELSTNALVHASGDFDVDVDRTDGDIVISITDHGGGVPAVQSPPSHEPHGRGLQIVAALSDDWGMRSGSGAGKTVWFRLSLRGASPGRQFDGATTP
jgi:anti-sigma regulatory factor (Ser/Thr protein kinase)